MRLVRELIRAKRDGGRLTDDELRAFVAGVTDRSVPDDQAAAMLMAIFFRGLDDGELAAWTDAMVRSGDVIDLSGVAAPKVDKHSTGGVGDKISLPLAPAVAACGVAVPMVSGRGLGHTGGTLDKLESIPGFRVDLPVERFRELVGSLGVCLIGQTERIAPADRRLYALRDVTATVDSIPLIASSILSKKLAEGIDALVLDCKVGSGAFMKTPAEARTLGLTIQAIGRTAGKPVTIVVSDMNQPLGATCGNALEVIESIEILRGGGPSDTRALTIALGAEMLLLGGVVDDAAAGAAAIAAALDDGRALDRMRRLVEAQGGDPRVCDEPERVLPRAPQITPIVAGRRGRITAIDVQALGTAVVVLGGGRRRKEDRVDPAVGLVVHARLGDEVAQDQPLVTVHHRDNGGLHAAAELVGQAYTIHPDAPPLPPRPLVHEVLRP